MTKLSPILILLIIFSIPANSRTIDDFVELAYNNGQLFSLKKTNQAEIASLEKDNSLTGVEVDFDHLWAKNNERRWSVGVTQSFEWPGLYKNRKENIAQTKLRVSLAEASLRNELRFQTITLLTKIAYAQLRANSLQKQEYYLKRIKNELDVSLESGLITILDRQKASLELINVTVAYSNTIMTRNQMIIELESLIGCNLDYESENWAEFIPLLGLDSLTTYLNKTNTDPYLMLLEAKEQESAMQLKIAKASNLPGFSIGYRHEMEEGQHFNGFSVGAKLPTWNFRRSTKLSEIEQEAAISTYQTAKHLAEINIRTQYAEALRLKNDLTVIKSENISDDYISLLTEALQAGEITLLDFLREQSFYAEALTQTLNMEEQYSLLLISLNRNNMNE